MYVLYAISGLALFASLLADRRKTWRALKIAGKKFVHILPSFLTMLILVSLVLFVLPDKAISTYLGHSAKWSGVFIAALLGSLTLMPGFIVFPLCGILLQKGVSYMVLAAFTTTLMMVGVLTFPVERAYFGSKVTLLRNLISLLIALTVAASIGLLFGEIL